MKFQKYISYSLWGEKPIYNIGIIKNILQAKAVYPGWRVIVYYDHTVPITTVEKIKNEGALTVNMSGISYGMFWRFFAADLPDCAYVIFRDCDSRLSIRDKLAVDEWIKSGKSIHIMRDHPYHKIPYGTDSLSILGGMWGIKGNLLPIRQLIEEFSQEKVLDYGIDQSFLKEIYNRFQKDAMVHDEFFAKAPFPVKREGYRFIGERIDEADQPVGEDWKVIKEHYENQMLSKRITRIFKRIYTKIKLARP